MATGQMSQPTGSKLEYVQAVRGLAAILVVYSHTGHSPCFGVIGVDIFFVLSGYMMAMIMQEGPGPAQFITRRFMRIAPLYFVCTLTAFIFSITVVGFRGSGYVPTWVEFIKSVLFVPYQAANGSYFPILIPGWTLNYEMYFYLCCALALFFTRKNHTIWTTAIVATCVMLGSLLVAGSTARLFLANPIVVEFVAGMLLWHVLSKPVAGAPILRSPYALPVALIVAFTLENNFQIYRSIPGDIRRVLLYGPLAAAVVALSIWGEPQFLRLGRLARKIFTEIGDASYAIYLTHLFVVGVLKHVLPSIGIKSMASSVGATLTVMSAVFVGLLVYRLVDAPIQRLLRRKFSGPRAIHAAKA